MLLQYLLGFRRLGFEVTFLDRLEPEMCGGVRSASSPNAAWLERTLRRFDLHRSFALYCDGGREVLGLAHDEVCRRTRRAVLFLNVMGFFVERAVLEAARRRVFLDIDPGFTQMWRALGQADVTTDHDTLVTIAENTDRPSCRIPTEGRRWVTTRPPVVLEHWPAAPALGRSFTTVATWRGPYAPVVYDGETYGLRVHEFRRFAELPRVTGARFELALDIHPDDDGDLSLLHAAGWVLVDPDSVAAEPYSYRAYIRGSAAEFCVAKGMYVQTRSGWLSDRSVCYLASGRPVLAQDTGFSENYPTGEGLLAFTDVEGATDGVDRISLDGPRQARAARRLAEEFFDSDRVLRRLVDEVQAA